MKVTAERTNEEEVLKILSEQAPVGVCIMQDGKICYANSIFPIAIGYTIDELLGRDSLEIVVPEDREMVRENTIKMLKGKLASPYQFRVIHKDGGIVWIMATVKSIQYRGRRAVLGNYMEVTERKQIEEQIRKSERHYRLLAENAEDVIWTVDITRPTRVTYVSPSVTRLLGYSVEESMTKEMEAIFTPASMDSAMKALAEEMAGEQKEHADQHRSRRLELQLRHKNGSLVDVEINFSFIRGADGQKHEILAVARDISGRKQMQEALGDSESRYGELADSITDIFFAMDEHLRYTYWNTASEVLTGIRAEDAIGKSLREIFPDTPGRKKAEREYRNVLKTRQPQTFVTDFDIGGRHYIFEVSGYPTQGGISVFVKDVTERKQAEEKLKESEHKYRTILEEMGDGYFETDLVGNITFVNDALIRILGYSKEEIIGMNFRAIRPKEHVKAIFEATKRMYKTGEPLRDRPAEVICKDGKHAFAETSAFPIRNDKGEIIGFRGIHRDITERKQAEEKLRESEQKYRLLFETSLDGIAQIDREGRYLAANPAMAGSLGVPLEELIGKTVLEVVPQEVAQHRLGMGRKALDEWQPQVFEDERVGRYFHNIVIPTKTSDQKEVVQVIARDITERKQAEEALQKSEERYRVLAENAGEAVFVVQDDVVKFINPKGVELCGYSAEELASLPFAKFIHPDDIDMVTDRHLRRLRGELVPQTYDFRIIRKDGDIRWGELNAVPISWEDRPAVLCFMSDITERKQAEEALRQSEERYRTMLEEMEDAYSEIDLGGHFTFVNNSVCRDLGYSKEELMGMSYKKFTAEDDIESVFRAFNEVYRTGVPNKGFSWKTTRKDGTHGFAETSVSPMRNDKGEIIGFRSVGRDISERKQTEEKLQRSRERYRALFDSSVIGTLVVDAETMKVVLGNQAAVKMFGFSSADEGAELNLLDFVPPEEKEKTLELLKKELFEQNSGQAFDIQTLTKDGRKVWISAAGARITHGGKLAGLLSFVDITERKKMEEALNLQRAYFQQLFDNSPDAIFMLDINESLIHANRGFETLFGYSAEELQGQSLRKLIVPKEDMEATSASLQRVFSGEIARRETVRRCKDGRLVHVSVLSYPICLDDKVIGACFTYTDITQRKQAEEKLRQSEENYKTLFNSSVIGMYVMDAETMKVVMGNRAAREMVGLSSAEEGIGVNPFDFVVPEDRERVLEIAINEFLQDSRRTHEIRVMNKDGRRRWQSISIARIMHKGRLASLVSFADITERKQAEEALRQSEENYRALFDNTVIGTIVIDAETMKVVMANQAAAKMFGLSSAEEGIGVDPLDFVLPDDRDRVSKIIVKDMFEQDLRQTNELRAVSKDGREIWISASGARIMHEGRIAGLISFTDITEQKRQNERLMMTDRLASLGELAAGTAHELNNPLTSVIGLSQLLMEKEVTDDIREDLKLINSEAQRAASVTKNLLTFARKHAPVKQPTQINNIIEDVLKLRAYEHKANSIKVDRQLAPDIPEIMADYFQIQQVFINIIINAEHFMAEEHKKGTLTITTKKQNNTVTISFADDGPGIPPENLRRIFDPFFTTKEAGKGTGLGLSICHGIVSEHGGQIYARSQSGKGAIFVVELPINNH
jgi:PAS domain S-box-containing protein